MEEQVAKLIYILTHNTKNCKVNFWFRHSDDTISHLHQVLRVILELEEKILIQPAGSRVPPEISNSDRLYL